MEKKKKPYEKPELKGKIIFEASGTPTGCCKTVALSCTGGGRSFLSKSQQNKDNS